MQKGRSESRDKFFQSKNVMSESQLLRWCGRLLALILPSPPVTESPRVCDVRVFPLEYILLPLQCWVGLQMLTEHVLWICLHSPTGPWVSVTTASTASLGRPREGRGR